MMRWMVDRVPGAMVAVLDAQAAALREQMKTGAQEQVPTTSAPHTDLAAAVQAMMG